MGGTTIAKKGSPICAEDCLVGNCFLDQVGGNGICGITLPYQQTQALLLAGGAAFQ
jgi:hypothetical protein